MLISTWISVINMRICVVLLNVFASVYKQYIHLLYTTQKNLESVERISLYYQLQTPADSERIYRSSLNCQKIYMYQCFISHYMTGRLLFLICILFYGFIDTCCAYDQMCDTIIKYLLSLSHLISYITISNFCEKQLIPNGATLIVQKTPFFYQKYIILF